jgi:hypothetical protein
VHDRAPEQQHHPQGGQWPLRGPTRPLPRNALVNPTRTKLVSTAIAGSFPRELVPVPGSIRCADAVSAACPASLTDACANNPPDLLRPR